MTSAVYIRCDYIINGYILTRIITRGVYDMGRSWFDHERGWLGRIHAVALSLACVGFVAFALFWRLFRFSIA